MTNAAGVPIVQPAPPVLLDGAAILKTYGRDGDSWLLGNIPLFECPDKDIEEIYYYRWWSYRKNLQWHDKFGGWTVHRTGNRYHKGTGLRVLVDGVEAAHSPTLAKLTIPFESRKPPAPPETRPTQECH